MKQPDIYAPETSSRFTTVHMTLLFLLRVAVGWHFLYEGLVKLLDPNWTSAGYLVESRWLFSGLFHWIIETPAVLFVVDIMNIMGLILIGLGLFFGFMTRLASISGALLLFLYYIVIPPLPSFIDGMHTEGSYLIVNKNLVELITLTVIAFLPVDRYLSLDRLYAIIKQRARLSAQENAIDASDGAKVAMPPVDRREILKSFAAVPFFGAFVISAAKRHGWKSIEERRLMEMIDGNPNAITSATMRTARFANLDDINGQLQTGRIGNVEMSRLICGGNLISGFAHARDLIYVSPFLKQYFTDEKVMDTLHLCEAAGINTAILRTDMDTIRVLNKYWKRGGKIQWLAQTYPSEEDPISNTKIALESGAVGAFIQGNLADRFVRSGRIDIIEKTLSYIKSRGVIAGVAGHQLQVPVAIEKSGLEPDFYMKTFHCRDYWSFQMADPPDAVVDNRLDNYWCMNPEETADFMKQVKRPWIAYKVLAAGSIKPVTGFKYTFENGADFACVGMFDFQVIDNVNTAHMVLSNELARSRPWMA